MLQSPKDELNPGPPAPPPDQRRCTERGRLTQPIDAVLARLIHDDDGHLAIRWTRRPQPHVGDAWLPRRLAPLPPLAVDEVAPFHLVPIGQAQGVGLLPLHQERALRLSAHLLPQLRVTKPT